MKELTSGNEGRLIFNFAMPMLLGNLFQQLYNIVDTIIVGNILGKEALAAVGASFPIVFTLISLIIEVASGGTIVIAQYFGAGDHQSVKKAIHTMYIFLTIASVVLTLVGIPLTDELFRLIRLPEEIMPEATTYLSIYLLGLLAFFGFNATSAILRGLGDSKTPLYFLMKTWEYLHFKMGIAAPLFSPHELNKLTISTVANSDAAKRDFGYKPIKSVAEGMQDGATKSVAAAREQS